ncbi:MAG: hypothetical protein H6739_39885 [Alphaproteobacteria bacterium]|nr:hypothetical protein [Alphaproteobacteria bacterium]
MVTFWPRSIPAGRRRAPLSLCDILWLNDPVHLAVHMLAGAALAFDADPYWEMRDRLTAEFMVVGAGPGHSLPATRRVDTVGHMKWADATVQLGWTLGVLATEYALLAEGERFEGYSQGGARTPEDTAAELAFALAALERVDAHDQAAFPDCPGPFDVLDGFFIRDDVSEDILEHFPDVTWLETDFLDPDVRNKEMSQDQAIHILLGLALVERWVPGDVAVDGMNLRQQAIDVAARIGAHVSAGGEWSITNPGCGDAEVKRGGEALVFSTGFAAALTQITGSTPDDGDAADLWASFASPDSPAFLNPDNQHMVMALAAVGDAFGDTTFDALMDLAAVHDWWAYPAAHVALHGWPEGRDEEVLALEAALAEDVDEVTPGDDIASPQPDGTAAHGYTVWNRYIRPGDEHYVGSDGTTGQRYAGVDYLLAFNLRLVAFDLAVEEETPQEQGCGCATGSGGGSGWALLAGLLALGRRYRYSATTST